MIPGLFDGFAAVDAHVKNHDRRAGHVSQKHRADLGDVAGASWAVDRERAIQALADALRHNIQPPQASARGTSLRRAESEPFDDLAGPLPVKCGGIHNHDPSTAAVPRDRDDAAVPEGPDTRLLCGPDPFDSRASQYFKP